MNPEQPQFEHPEREEQAKALQERIKTLLLKTASFEVVVDRIGSLGKTLQEKYPDHTQYRLYHALAGSSIIPERPISHFDFPGEDSVEAFINRLEEEFGKREQNSPISQNHVQ